MCVQSIKEWCINTRGYDKFFVGGIITVFESAEREKKTNQGNVISIQYNKHLWNVYCVSGTVDKSSRGGLQILFTLQF